MRETSRVLALALAVFAAGVGCQNSAARRGEQEEKEPKPARQTTESLPSVVELRHVVAPKYIEPKPQKVASVGDVAPDFELPAYHKGKFTTVKLSDHRGKWLLLCFYPGDFTFV